MQINQSISESLVRRRAGQTGSLAQHNSLTKPVKLKPNRAEFNPAWHTITHEPVTGSISENWHGTAQPVVLNWHSTCRACAEPPRLKR